MKSIFKDVEYVKFVIENSESNAEVLRVLGLPRTGILYKRLKKFSIDENIDLPIYANSNRRNSVSDSDIFVENSTYLDNRNIKNKLVHNYNWKYQCMVLDCEKPEPVWSGKPIALQLDHINGISNDNRIENLRFICPNCHSQTITFGSRNFAGNRINPKQFCDCGRTKNNSSAMCLFCSQISRIGKNLKIKWPPIAELVLHLSSNSFLKVSKDLGISDNAIRKHLRVNGINSKTLLPFD